MDNKKADLPDWVVWMIIGLLVLVVGSTIIYFAGGHGSTLIADIRSRLPGLA